jgi:retron-type reverse transcriptase
MKWESLISLQNLKLAWRRINTGKNLQHKRFYRDLYLVYETALDQNLRSLREQLLARAWNPTHPTRLYVPKPSGLQRPISLLGLEDQILLQAVANLVAKKLSKKRKLVELNTVFSNILSDPADSIFFLRPWQETYYAFQEKCTTLHSEGNHWIAHFDLAAFYDTISHDLILRIISPQKKHAQTLEIIRQWLGVWSSSKDIAMTSHGIPQGPIASNFLAEAFFLPIDKELNKLGIKYIRYVDDIRLFGKSEFDARNSGIILERLCRDRGLIPQGKKYSISYAKKPADALGSLPSIPPDENEEINYAMPPKLALRILRSCIDRKPLRINDKTRFRYIMYRAPKSSKILDIVMLLLPQYPEHIDVFTAYFGNYKLSNKIYKGISAILKEGMPYTYVRGELWHLLARLCTKEQLRKLLAIARKDLIDRERCLGLSWGVMHFMIRCQEENLIHLGTRLRTEKPFSRALLANRIPLIEFSPKRVIVAMLKGTTEEQLAASRQLQKRQISLTQLNIRPRALSQNCQNSLRALGVIRRVSFSPRDWISERLQKYCRNKLPECWRNLLGAEYEHSLQVLIEADAIFDLDRSSWLMLQDSFNNIIVKSFIEYLKQRNKPGGNQSTVDKNGNLVRYGNLLNQNGPFGSAHPTISKNLLIIHERRNELPGAHPYNQKGGAKNKWLSRQERDILVNYLADAIFEMSTFISLNP